ncbi:hypothetical protein [Sphingomonas sp.]|jgi:hypothetical protein|uniref:hypothetical protein n=1 Tax=Sphingomonas sp. TaxID=28214 RepID=UPI002D7EBE80|nr:hypothetical protein [Sphingomonas sp.]HEU0044648.1 hypothetical protein [Sphingomonas sp.]
MFAYDRRPQIGWMTRAFVTAAILVVAATLLTLAFLPRPLTPDVTGQLWIADQLRHGARLYLDISEPNPPLWFWLAMPIDAIADTVRARAADVLIVAIGCVTMLSLATCARLGSVRRLLLAYAAAILIIMPMRDLGQREQLTLILSLPYIFLAAMRREGMALPLWLALLVGVQAALGFALKHYFVAVPVLLELWLAVSLRQRWRPLRIETLTLAAGAVAYAAAVHVLTPEFLTASVPATMLAYPAASTPELRFMIRPAQPIWALVILGIIGLRRSSGRALPSLSVAFLLAAAGFATAWLIQLKGWPYHSIPTTGCLALALVAFAFGGAGDRGLRLGVLPLAGLILPLLLFAIPTQWRPDARTDIAPAFVGLGEGDVVAVIAREGWTSWPGLANRGLRFAGQGGSLWILQAVDGNEAGARDPRIAELGRQMVRKTAHTFRCLPPRRVVFYPGRVPDIVTSAADNPRRYFLQGADFARVMDHYRQVPTTGLFDAFEQVRPLAPPVRGHCPRRP